MRRLPAFLAPLVVLVGAILVTRYVLQHPPAAVRTAPRPPAAVTVAVVPVEPRAYTVMVESFGRVAPRTASRLVAQVGGQIIDVSPAFREGGFFTAGERLVQIDPRDYEIALAAAEAEVVRAEQALIEERARAAQAARDWARLGDGGAAPDLVSRQPQLAAAAAAVAAARANADRARLDLERTEVRAPYAGRVRARQADLGQVVAPNTALADIYATDAVEVALPLKPRDLPYLELPEARARRGALPSAVELRASLPPHLRWEATLVRTEGAIDESTRQLRVVAQIAQPYAAGAAVEALRIGEYVTASITGRELDAAIVIPTDALYEARYVYVVAAGVLARRPVEVAWRNTDEAIVAAGLAAGEALVVTPLGRVSSGTPARVVGTDAAAPTGETP